MEHHGLFIDDLQETLSRIGVARGAESQPEVTTQALGEEGEQPDEAVVTSDALGEEGDQADEAEVTTQALGEEGEQSDDQSFDSDWGSWTVDDDVPVDEAPDGYDDDAPFDVAL